MLVASVMSERSPWRGVLLQSAPSGSKAADWPVARGTVQQLTGRSMLGWINAVSRGLSLSGGRYNPNVKGLPTPLGA